MCTCPEIDLHDATPTPLMPASRGCPAIASRAPQRGLADVRPQGWLKLSYGPHRASVRGSWLTDEDLDEETVSAAILGPIDVGARVPTIPAGLHRALPPILRP